MKGTAYWRIAGLGWAAGALALSGCGRVESLAPAPAGMNEPPSGSSLPVGSKFTDAPLAPSVHPTAGVPVPCGGVVATKHGPVIGAVDEGACAFQGIPFAAPPTAALRWKPPQP